MQQKSRGMLTRQGKQGHSHIEINDKPLWGSYDEEGHTLQPEPQHPSNARTELQARDLRRITLEMVLEKSHRAADLPHHANFAEINLHEYTEVRSQRPGGRIHKVLDLNKSYIIPTEYTPPPSPPAADPGDRTTW